MVTGVGVPIHRLSRKTTEDTETPQKTQKFFLCVLCASLRLCVTLGVLCVPSLRSLRLCSLCVSALLSWRPLCLWRPWRQPLCALCASAFSASLRYYPPIITDLHRFQGTSANPKLPIFSSVLICVICGFLFVSFASLLSLCVSALLSTDWPCRAKKAGGASHRLLAKLKPRRRYFFPNFFLNASLSAGTISHRSPTTP